MNEVQQQLDRLRWLVMDTPMRTRRALEMLASITLIGEASQTPVTLSGALNAPGRPAGASPA